MDDYGTPPDAVMSSVLRLRVAIPHFCREGSSEQETGYGSTRAKSRLPRSVALARCLGSVLALNRSPSDWILNIAEKAIEPTPTSRHTKQRSVHVELHLFVSGEDWLKEVVECFASRIHVHQLDLDDPQHLPLQAVRQLLDMGDSADFSMYLEDDLVVQDPYYLDKFAWFCQRTDHQFVLMPHRKEPSVANAPQSLYVDGPIKEQDQAQSVWASDEQMFANGRFWDGQEIEFVEASNPHSGSFCVSRPQLEKMRNAPWPPPSFVGPLETAATGSVFNIFPVLKPSWACRDFLNIEHGNPSFIGLMNQLPIRGKL